MLTPKKSSYGVRQLYEPEDFGQSDAVELFRDIEAR